MDFTEKTAKSTDAEKINFINDPASRGRGERDCATAQSSGHRRQFAVSGAETDSTDHAGPREVAVERAEAVGGVVPAATRKESA